MTSSEAGLKARTTTDGEKGVAQATIGRETGVAPPPSHGSGEPRRSSQDERASGGGAVRPADDEPSVRLDHVSKRFGALTVLDDVTLDVPRGKAFCLLGRSGTGKSVLLRHIIGLVQPDGGKVFVEGRDITALKGRELGEVRKHMGFLFQNAALFDSMTVGDNVAFPMRRHTDWPDGKIREHVQQKLATVGLEKDFDKMPGDLSGGMKKRAGLARAMALDPSILLVDEPSAGLDPITASEIDDLLVETKRTGTTLVVVTHNIPSARVVGDEFGVLHEGRLLARGTLEELDASQEPLVQAFMRSPGGG